MGLLRHVFVKDIAAKYRVTSGSASFENRFLSIVPVRVAA